VRVVAERALELARARHDEVGLFFGRGGGGGGWGGGGGGGWVRCRFIIIRRCTLYSIPGFALPEPASQRPAGRSTR
jgi:hypothetical protein